jgi:AcrR family transcriptional regulator
MAIDMKKVIAQKTEELLQQDRNRELTVTDIAQACGIARQSFYYHFEDIPHLMDYIMTQRDERLRKRIAEEHLSLREIIREILLMASTALPDHPKEDRMSKYRQEMQQVVIRHAEKIIHTAGASLHLFPDKTEEERAFLIRYHMTAIGGILIHWTEEDDAHLDEIADLIASQIRENEET